MKKVNRGIIVLLCLLLAVVVYVVCISVKGKSLKSQSNDFVYGFLEKDVQWRNIPLEYQNDSDGYIKSIENEVKNYFYDESAYDFYIQNAILSQYQTGNFCPKMSVSLGEFSDSYDGKYVDCNFYVFVDAENTASMENEFNTGSGQYTIRLCENKDSLQIISHNYLFTDYFDSSMEVFDVMSW